MNIASTTTARQAASIVQEYFSTPINALLGWVDSLAEEVAGVQSSGGLTRARLDTLVEPYALRTLTAAPFYGAGFIAAIDLLTDAHSHLAWWQGEDRRQLVLASQTVNKENIDYSELEWYRVPMSTGEPHVAGPHVDYLCSDEYTITIAVPASVEGTLIGVAGVDVLVSAVERELTPRFTTLGSHQVTVVNAFDRVVISTDPRHATGDSVRGSELADLPRAACAGLALTVIVEAR
ncbi:MAG: cache domain-containing protein [Microbacterium sp.]|uniref:cache domain-containing protein n=1 Tax=Microbacterium sp. TaxID=51671 RepID=UPI003F9A8FE2